MPAKAAWQYSTNGGGSWTSLGNATTTAAIALNATDLLRFVPAANFNGAATALSANLIESGQAITSGAILDLTGATGGTTHISTATVALSETVNPVNDAPSGAVTIDGTAAEDQVAHGEHRDAGRCRRAGRVQLSVACATA